MKKVFLVFGVAAFSAASAQQKELFDIQKHLQKKTGENKKTVPDERLLLPFKNSFSYTDLLPGFRADQSYLLPNGDKVVISGIDNMPCIQQDMGQFKAMPNPGFGSSAYPVSHSRPLPGEIPNGASPRTIIVRK